MSQYTNRFQYAINGARSELNLNFLQEFPEIPLDNTKPISVGTETVASLVMSIDTAQELLKMLKAALEKE